MLEEHSHARDRSLERNKHGLTRTIPPDVKLAVRKRDKFGCVICGKAIVEYEHVDPEFKDAKSHSVDGIVLLCIGCHGKKTKGHLAVSTIKEAMKNPAATRNGFSHEAFDVGGSYPEIALGDFTGRGVRTLLEFNGERIIAIDPPEQEGGPFRISARICDAEGNLVLEIVENEWRTSTANWDVDVVGPRIKIRNGPRRITMIVRTEPPSRLVFERLELEHRGFCISAHEEKGLTLTWPSGSKRKVEATTVDGCEVGIAVRGTTVIIGEGRGSVSIGYIGKPDGMWPVYPREAYEVEEIPPPRPIGELPPVGPGRGQPRPIIWAHLDDSCPCGSGQKVRHCQCRGY